MTDLDAFPHPVYRDTVLAPLFEGVRAHYAAGMDAINRAHLVMLVETGILSRAEGAALAGALDAISAEVDPAALTYTGEHEDWFFLVEAQLRERLGDLGGALHTARSRNDMDHTLFKMALRPRVARVEAQVHDLAGTMLAKARAERDTLIVAYTHGQPAQPSTFGHYLAAATEVLLRDAARLSDAADGLEHSPMGAAAITTSGFPIDRARVAELLGFEGVLLNSYGCIASVDYVTGLYSAMKLPFVHLGRLVQDFAYWSAFEVGQLHLPRALVQISSIMPQKRNPVPIEHMRHLAAVTAGRCDMMVDTMRNTPFTDMNDSEGEVQQAGYAAFESGGRMLDLLAAVIAAARIDGARVRRNADAACVTITELADTLVRDEGLTFRAAHHVAAETARAVIAEGVPLGVGHAAFARAFEAQTGRATRLDAGAFAEATSPETFVARRDRPGGPAPAALDAAFDSYDETLARLRDRTRSRAARHAAADRARAAAFAALQET
ncbi:argininosuccinate lyase [Jannaschia seohaensis]|uniref:Argininosuccinate lyase n=1 Tax=Jannaschia seohaensis TaxID=475081 RepID=A0A2Y9B8U4_9RHOB|nr:argininosuccinate lyase [Jannaschia seohaensis]PWJ11450.1 argininosuccinate lyase [Jannaschia seohaensis]SSA51427.1 argininosuccinate lyase [Jannaschia seohaensis]